MTWKRIEACREARLWLVQIGLPAATVAALILKDPENRKKISQGFNSIKTNVKNKFAK